MITTVCVHRWLECVGCVGAVQQRVRRWDSNPDQDLPVSPGGVIPVWGCGGGGPAVQLAVLHRWAAHSVGVCVGFCAFVCTIHPFLLVCALVVQYDCVVFSNCVFTAIFFKTFPFWHHVHLLVKPSSVSQCSDLRSACWKGDFDWWELTMTWSAVFKTMHAQYVQIITPTNG